MKKREVEKNNQKKHKEELRRKKKKNCGWKNKITKNLRYAIIIYVRSKFKADAMARLI